MLLSRWGIACVHTSPPLSQIFPGGGGAAFVDRLVNLFTGVNDDLIHAVDKTPFCPQKTVAVQNECCQRVVVWLFDPGLRKAA